MKKSPNLKTQTKNCVTCNRSFHNRKTWESRGQWSQIIYCSTACRKQKNKLKTFIEKLSESDRGKIVRATLADDVPFENIFVEYGLVENQVIAVMKKLLPLKQFIRWRVRARGNKLKHLKKIDKSKLKIRKNNKNLG